MRLINQKCPNCGAAIEETEEKIYNCAYCGSRFESEDEAVNSFKTDFVPNRPYQSIDLTIILFFIFFFPAIIYSFRVLHRKKHWDDMYGNTTLGMYYINTPRPRFSWILALSLFYMGVIPAIIYISYYRRRSEEWTRQLESIKVQS